MAWQHLKKRELRPLEATEACKEAILVVFYYGFALLCSSLKTGEVLHMPLHRLLGLRPLARVVPRRPREVHLRTGPLLLQAVLPTHVT